MKNNIVVNYHESKKSKIPPSINFRIYFKCFVHFYFLIFFCKKRFAHKSMYFIMPGSIFLKGCASQCAWAYTRNVLKLSGRPGVTPVMFSASRRPSSFLRPPCSLPPPPSSLLPPSSCLLIFLFLYFSNPTKTAIQKLLLGINEIQWFAREAILKKKCKKQKMAKDQKTKKKSINKVFFIKNNNVVNYHESKKSKIPPSINFLICF